MTSRNTCFTNLKTSYLFPEVTKRKNVFLKQNPVADLINLSIGDTTEPIPEVVASQMASFAKQLKDADKYKGYGPEQGRQDLREKIAEKIYGNLVKADDVFISDGAKCDIGRLQLLFGNDVSVAIQDPSYPVYVDGSILHGVKKIVYLPSLPENDFFPDLEKMERTDLVYFCSPNNPTGKAYSYSQLEKLVQFARKNCSIILFDAAYAPFIRDKNLPKSIYEIDGAKEVAIEVNSFSKLAGFTGIRLGWTVVPEEIKYESGEDVRADWNRIMTTLFNGASNIAQEGGMAVLGDEGLKHVRKTVDFYLENVRLIKEHLLKERVEVYGGEHAPYLWVHFLGRKSWDLFQEFLEKWHIVTTPGSGFGGCGEGFLRMTGFGKRDNILKALQRLKF